MWQILIIIQSGTTSHSSQIAKFDSYEAAEQAYLCLKGRNSVYAITVTKLY